MYLQNSPFSFCERSCCATGLELEAPCVISETRRHQQSTQGDRADDGKDKGQGRTGEGLATWADLMMAGTDNTHALPVRLLELVMQPSAQPSAALIYILSEPNNTSHSSRKTVREPSSLTAALDRHILETICDYQQHSYLHVPA